MIPPLYPILDSSYLPGERQARNALLSSWISELADAGVELLQYRNKRGAYGERVPDADLMRALAPAGMRLIMNDHPGLALAVKFDGVHVGQQDTPPAEARYIFPAGLIGISTHNEAQLRAADSSSADYVAIGPIFATKTKLDASPVVGLDGLNRARRLTRKPLVAIGGITLENARQVRDAGADSVAVISAIFGASERPGKLAKDFLRLFE